MPGWRGTPRRLRNQREDPSARRVYATTSGIGLFEQNPGNLLRKAARDTRADRRRIQVDDPVVDKARSEQRAELAQGRCGT